MQFKKFNGSTWETVQHKIYGSGTDSLTAFPAMIQASGESLTDYTIYGNTLQNGTPTPEAPVDVVGCGVWDEAHQSYKLPLTVNGTEYPIYLGQVETTRRIRKLVLTGEEKWVLATTNLFSLAITPAGTPITGSKSVECTHFIGTPSRSTYSQLYSYQICVRDTGTNIWIRSNDISSVADFKSFLVQQYANGTPVTVWYVLAEPDTGIVNEPLHKIGAYADTITMAQAEVAIGTSDGDNTITFGTYVQPSAMSATFKGWHAIPEPKVYDGNEWR